MRFSVAVAVAALTVSTSALPTEGAREVLRVPLSGRNDFVSRDGIANVARLRDHLSRSTLKYRQGSGAYDLIGKRDDDMQEHKHPGGEPLMKVGHGNLWQGEIEVGNPPVKFLVDFETGMSDFFLPGPGCQGCTNHTQYDPTSSKTSVNLSTPFNWLSADGSEVNGTLYKDTVNIGGVTVKSQVFGAAASVTPTYWLYLFPTDGLLGFGFPGNTTLSATPVFHNMIKQGRVARPEFAVKLDDLPGSELTLGGVNHTLYKGDFYYSPITNKGNWQIEMEALSINGTKALGKTQVVVDSGIRLNMGETSNVAKLMSKIPGSKDGTKTIAPGFWSIPCDGIPTISLTFAGKTFDISPETFNFGQLNGTNDCVAGFAGAPMDPNVWIIGDLFMRNAYSVFDVGEERIGFAEYA